MDSIEFLPPDGVGPATPLVQYPKQGSGQVSARPEQVLLICYYDPAGVSTVPETVSFLQSHSRFSMTVLNMHEHRQDMGNLRLHPWVRLDAFAAVIIHNTVSYNVDNLRSLDQGLAPRLRDFGGVKVLMKQDENYRFREMARYVGETGFDLVFTCLPPEAVAQVYPPDVVGPVRFERMLTGYVTPTLRARRIEATQRPIDVGYRGSIQPLAFGWLAYEKRKIGDDVARLLQGQGLALDISSRWEDRIGGDDWLEFLASCKATLGAESGASIFDLDGNLDERCKALEKQYADVRDEGTKAEAVLCGLADLEGNVHYNQVSPRHFEAAACGAVQLMFPGAYSGLLVPGRHYFQLERDYSNLDEAVDFIRDEARRSEMARRAFEEVVLERNNWIETLIDRIDTCVEQAVGRRGLAYLPTLDIPPAHNLLLVAAHDPIIDPRLGWIEEGASTGLRVHQLGVLPPEAAQPRLEHTSRGNLVMAYPRLTHRSISWLALAGQVDASPAGAAGVRELIFLQQAVELPEVEFCRLFGAPPGAARNDQFRWYLRYMLDTAATLLHHAQRLRGVHVLIATDLDTLAPALVLKGLLRVPLIYDAHEYWPDADPSSYEYEKQFWVGLERRLSRHADRRQTVSTGLADFMSGQYGVTFETVPNCELADRLLPPREPAHRADGTCHFLFQGNFAVGRGIDLLIRAWAATDPRAILLLRGPDNDYKTQMLKLASDLGPLSSRIFFPPPVAERDMIRVSVEADVGLIPYARTGTVYTHCCPNKMSQYMAAGLPILANNTEFVAATVRDAGCGLVVDFARRDELLRAVAAFCEDLPRRQGWADAGRDYFRQKFNWNLLGQRLYAPIERMLSAAPQRPLTVYAELPPHHLTVPPSRLPAPSPRRSIPSPSLSAPVAASAPQSLPVRSRLASVLRALWRGLPLQARHALKPIAIRLRRLAGL